MFRRPYDTKHAPKKSHDYEVAERLLSPKNHFWFQCLFIFFFRFFNYCTIFNI